MVLEMRGTTMAKSSRQPFRPPTVDGRNITITSSMASITERLVALTTPFSEGEAVHGDDYKFTGVYLTCTFSISFGTGDQFNEDYGPENQARQI